MKLVVDAVALYKTVQHDPRVMGQPITLPALTQEILFGCLKADWEGFYIYDKSNTHMLAFGILRKIDRVNKNAHLTRIVALLPKHLVQLCEAFMESYPGFTLTAYRRGRHTMLDTHKIIRSLRYANRRYQSVS